VQSRRRRDPRECTRRCGGAAALLAAAVAALRHAALLVRALQGRVCASIEGCGLLGSLARVACVAKVRRRHRQLRRLRGGWSADATHDADRVLLLLPRTHYRLPGRRAPIQSSHPIPSTVSRSIASLRLPRRCYTL